MAAERQRHLTICPSKEAYLGYKQFSALRAEEPEEPLPRVRTPNARKGRMTKAEKALLEAVDPKADIREAAIALAPVLQRNPEALRAAIVEARERLVNRAGQYADLHLQAAQVAAGQGNAKPAEWALERLSYAEERIVEPTPRGPEGPVGTAIQVRIEMPFAPGGFKPSAFNNLPTVEVVEAQALPAVQAINEG